MKSKFLAVLTLALMMAPLSLFAASGNSKKFTTDDTFTVGGTQLPPGTYRVEWDGTGTVNATIQQGKKVVATVPATVTQEKSRRDGAAVQTEGKVLQGVQWKDVAIQFNQGASSANAGQ